MNDSVGNSVVAALHRAKLIEPDEQPHLIPLTGGVSSDIWRIDTSAGPLCVKMALPKLKVAADWRAPVERNRYEAAWIDTASKISPDCVPELLFHDADAGLFAMRYLDPEDYAGWKDMLRDGNARTSDAFLVGSRLGAIHAATAGDAGIVETFATDDIFEAIRIEPYLLATAKRHPRLSDRLLALAETTRQNRQALVHGDVSPKNILIGPNGPVFLDAECAWYGDPAFDVAFCLNHLLLKCLWTPGSTHDFLSCFQSLCSGYQKSAPSLSNEVVDRTAKLLPALMLARVDGKSPVEYITEERQRDVIRDFAATLLTSPADHPIEIGNAWRTKLDRRVP